VVDSIRRGAPFLSPCLFVCLSPEVDLDLDLDLDHGNLDRYFTHNTSDSTSIQALLPPALHPIPTSQWLAVFDVHYAHLHV
jgi:hypothetical protein